MLVGKMGASWIAVVRQLILKMLTEMVKQVMSRLEGVPWLRRLLTAVET
jgi:hypothetical protein